MADLEHVQRVPIQHADQLLEMVVEKLDCFELMAANKDVTAKREAKASASGLGVGREQDCALVVRVRGYRIVVGATEAGLDDRPAVMSPAAEK